MDQRALPTGADSPGRMVFETVPLTPLVCEVLRGADGPMLVTDIRRLILATGVLVEAGEITSVLSKLLGKEKVRRQKRARVSTFGRAEVWAYEWANK